MAHKLEKQITGTFFQERPKPHDSMDPLQICETHDHLKDHNSNVVCVRVCVCVYVLLLTACFPL